MVLQQDHSSPVVKTAEVLWCGENRRAHACQRILLLFGPGWTLGATGRLRGSTGVEEMISHPLCVVCVCVCRVYHPASGRVLEVWTSQPGLQFYTANYLDGSVLGKGGSAYGKHSSFCLETQNWPDAVNQVC